MALTTLIVRRTRIGTVSQQKCCNITIAAGANSHQGSPAVDINGFCVSSFIDELFDQLEL